MNSLLFLTALALAPGIYLAIVIYGKDKYDREPKKVLLTAFLLGCLSILPAAILEFVFEKWLNTAYSGVGYTAIKAFLIVALTEEMCKFTMLRMHAFRLSAFNEPFDGIVYAVFVGLGFATAENLLYVLNDGWGTGLLRMFTAVPAHYAFAVMMGYYVGKAKFDPQNQTTLMIQGILYATVLHGAYDFFIFQNAFPALGILTILILVKAINMSKRAVQELQADSVFRFKQNQSTVDSPDTSAEHT